MTSLKPKSCFRIWLITTLILVFTQPLQIQSVLAQSTQSGEHQATVFATGFNNPRGLKFGPDKFLYVAEGGLGGTTTTTESQCTQVVPPIGPYSGGLTARISKVSPTGERTTVVDGLPSAQTSAISGRLISGVADVAFVGNHLYALLSGAGCSKGNPDIPNAIIQVNDDGSWSILANLSQFLKDNPVKNPDYGDFEPDGTWYSMVYHDGAFYAVEPNHAELDKITIYGEISRVVDISASQGHIVPTSVDEYQNDFYVGNLSSFPIIQGAAKIMKITRKGEISEVYTGLTNIEGVVVDHWGRIYVLESTVGQARPTPNSGQIVRINPDGTIETITTALSLPTAMTIGPDGNLYVSNKGFGYPAGMGEILKIDIDE